MLERPAVRLVRDGPPVLSYRPPTFAEVRWFQEAVQARAAQRFPEVCANWNWPALAGLCVDTGRTPSGVSPAERVYRLASIFTRKARFDWHIIAAFHNEKPRQPLALAIYLPRTKGLRPADPQTLYLEWFMAQPRDMHGYGQQARFGQYLMDWLILRSHRHGLDGRVSLHAASESLRRVYESSGFRRIDPNERLIRNRRNNCLFYELPPDNALALNAALDHLR